jgi:hypothetical protein
MCTDAECALTKFWKILLYHQYMLSQIDDMNVKIYLFSVKRMKTKYKILLR